jgi:hypothetical protein
MVPRTAPSWVCDLPPTAKGGGLPASSHIAAIGSLACAPQAFYVSTGPCCDGRSALERVSSLVVAQRWSTTRSLAPFTGSRVPDPNRQGSVLKVLRSFDLPPLYQEDVTCTATGQGSYQLQQTVNGSRGRRVPSPRPRAAIRYGKRWPSAITRLFVLFEHTKQCFCSVRRVVGRPHVKLGLGKDLSLVVQRKLVYKDMPLGAKAQVLQPWDERAASAGFSPHLTIIGLA